MSEHEPDKHKQEIERLFLEKNERLAAGHRQLRRMLTHPEEFESVTLDPIEGPYDPRDYNDGPLTKEQWKAIWTNHEQFEAACDELFQRYKSAVRNLLPSKPSNQSNQD